MSLFKIKGEPVQLFPAKVKEVYYKDDLPESTFYIKALVLDGYNSNREVNARPLFVNTKQPPLKGETVLLLSTISSYSTGLAYNEDLYYLGIINLQGNVHHNSLPNVNEIEVKSEGGGNSNSYQSQGASSNNTKSDNKVDDKFPESSLVKSLQPYLGDVIIEGRFGSSIRFTSTLKDDSLYTKKPNWKKADGEDGDPLVILRASKPNTSTGKTNDFITEDFKKDDSIVVLASSQQLDFDPSSKETDSIKNQSLDSWDKGKKYSGKQILLSSGRIIFNSTQNEIVAFAKAGIALSSASSISIDANKNIEFSSNKILLGKNSDEPLVLGNEFKKWMDEFIDALGKLTAISAVGPSSPFEQSPQWYKFQVLKNKFDKHLSNLSYTKKSK